MFHGNKLTDTSEFFKFQNLSLLSFLWYLSNIWKLHFLKKDDTLKNTGTGLDFNFHYFKDSSKTISFYFHFTIWKCKHWNHSSFVGCICALTTESKTTPVNVCAQAHTQTHTHSLSISSSNAQAPHTHTHTLLLMHHDTYTYNTHTHSSSSVTWHTQYTHTHTQHALLLASTTSRSLSLYRAHLGGVARKNLSTLWNQRCQMLLFEILAQSLSVDLHFILNEIRMMNKYRVLKLYCFVIKNVFGFIHILPAYDKINMHLH
jgi:hypothetical protein